MWRPLIEHTRPAGMNHISTEAVLGLIWVESKGQHWRERPRYRGLLQQGKLYMIEAGESRGAFERLVDDPELSLRAFWAVQRRYIRRECADLEVAILHKGGPRALRSWRKLREGRGLVRGARVAGLAVGLDRLGVFMGRYAEALSALGHKPQCNLEAKHG